MVPEKSTFLHVVKNTRSDDWTLIPKYNDTGHLLFLSYKVHNS